VTFKRTIKRVLALLTCAAGIPLLMIAGMSGDVVIRILTIVAGGSLMISGAIQFWLLRKRRKKSWADDVPY
jgi:hypothetical protein